MSTDWRSLAAELAAELERCRPLAEVPDCLARARTALARYGHQPAPPAAGEQRHPTPVPVAERLPGPGDCDALGYCWWWDPLRQESWEYCITGGGPDWYWLPFNALPLPAGEGEK